MMWYKNSSSLNTVDLNLCHQLVQNQSNSFLRYKLLTFYPPAFKLAALKLEYYW